MLVGAGGYGRLYVEALTSQDMGAELTAICDIDPNLAERVPQIRQRQIPVYPTLDAFFAKDSADLAVLVSPVHFHTDMVLSCLEHGVNVLCEKPLCLTVKEAAAMQEASKKTGKFLCIGYQLNYRRDVQALKRDILLGRFGKAKHIAVYHGFRRGAAYYARNNWAGRITCQGREVFDSPFTNACAHHFQMLTFLLGPTMRTACDIESVQAELYRANPRLKTMTLPRCGFKRHRAAAPVLYGAPDPHRVLGAGGRVEFENATITYTREKPVFRGVMADGSAFDYSGVAPGADMQKLMDAIQAVDSGDPPFCGVEADLPHIHAVRLVQQNPITPVRSELVQPVHTDTDDFYCVKNLEQMLVHCAENRALPSELGIQLG
ncbi:MAG: Gfo/Idh/MocA family protein [Ruthenibacterium lactatiformans]